MQWKYLPMDSGVGVEITGPFRTEMHALQNSVQKLSEEYRKDQVLIFYQKFKTQNSNQV